MLDEISNLKELKQLEAQLIKVHGENYFPITQEKEKLPVEFISTDCFSLDSVIGGGIPKGRIIEFSGAESSCKSTISYHTIAAYQKRGLVCALLDSENAFSPEYAKALGVDVNKLMILSQCLTAKSLAAI